MQGLVLLQEGSLKDLQEDIMACIDADGTLTPTGRALLQALAGEPMSPEDVASRLGQPIFRVRGSLRELSGAELIEEDGGVFKVTEAGTGML